MIEGGLKAIPASRVQLELEHRHRQPPLQPVLQGRQSGHSANLKF